MYLTIMVKTHEQNFIAVACIWYERYLECSRMYGTRMFTKAVWSFYHSLLDIDHDERAIKTKVTKYLNDEWLPLVKDNASAMKLKDKVHGNDVESHKSYNRIAEDRMAVYLYEHIIQTIQDSGIGWPTNEEITTYLYPNEKT